MGFFSKKNKTSIPWINLTSVEELETAIQQSNEKPVALFKHSTRCSISSMAKSRLERSWDLSEKVDIYYLDLIAFRPVSNKIAEVLNVTHESPQIILLKDGKAIYHTSHSDISVEGLAEQL